MVNDMANDLRTELMYLIESTPDTQVDAAIFIADHLIANGVTVQDSKLVENDQFKQWISVKDRLPEKDKLVLCIGKRGGMFIGEIHPFLVGRERNEVYCDVPNSRQGRYAIYWMPLPQPPKGE